MLDSETKRRINSLRDILVGKIPDPKSQVEQITTGLIYKFMYDIDKESVEMGGVASFFAEKYEKYSWDKLFDPKLSGVDRVKLYGAAIEAMYTNPNAPTLFREIFKNSYLPFKDPPVLTMFLKQIDEFEYSHSEKLGDAFEYLLSFMGSQGDAGQFRTPRHIIDFIVEIVNPQKHERILDPACGTAGFLISSYKHILAQNTGETLDNRLSAADRKKIDENIVGYDISPDMTRISLVNLHLHQFADPKIYEYDTLSSEDRWDEYYDIILANPPFFSPKGGSIQPHSRFGVQSTRAEVLFVDYIMEHLTSKGRAGIIVPEGIIFQTGTAYKYLRKKLVEECLVGVISLPAGVFNPYSGVKTSILILDKTQSKKSDSIFFAKVKNDGFSLGAQRTQIASNDLPEIINNISLGKASEKIRFIEKNTILEDTSIELSGKVKRILEIQSDYDLVKLDQVTIIQNGFAFKGEDYQNSGFRVIRITNVQNGQIEDTNPKFHPKLEPKDHEKYSLYDKDILISLTGNVGRVGRLTYNLEPAYLNQRVCKIEASKPDQLLSDYLFWMLNSHKFEIECIENSSGIAQKNLSTNWIKEYKIPLPPIEVQQKIVEELEGYQKIIDGCRQVIENYKPTINIDPTWEMIKLEEIVTVFDSKRKPLKKSDRVKGEYPYYGATGIIDYVNDYIFDEQLVLIGEDGAKWNENEASAFIAKGKYWVNNHAHVVKPVREKILDIYLVSILSQLDLSPFINGITVPKLNQKNLLDIEISLPPLEVQQKIVDDIIEQQKVIEGNKRLVEIYMQKIQDRISKIWGD